MSGAHANLQLLPSGELPEDAPQTYAEALIQLDERQRDLDGATARADRLAQENEHLTTALGKAHGQLQRVKAELHKDLRLSKDYATVERLWEKYRQWHPRSGEQVPEDWLKLALARLKDFEEHALARALDGAHLNAPVSDDGKTAYDKWDNVFRSTGHVHRYIERADQAEGRAHREREKHPEVARVLGRLGVASLGELANVCDRCGRLMIVHGSGACDDPDDTGFRSERWIDEQEARVLAGRSVSEAARARVALRREDDGR